MAPDSTAPNIAKNIDSAPPYHKFILVNKKAGLSPRFYSLLFCFKAFGSFVTIVFPFDSLCIFGFLINYELHFFWIYHFYCCCMFSLFFFFYFHFYLIFSYVVLIIYLYL